MMGGGGRTMAWVVGEVETEDGKEDEVLSGAEVVICSLVVGDKTLGVQGCTTVGSKMSLDTKVSDQALTRFRSGKGSRSRLCKLSGSPKKEGNL
jgi:hypothetical protein